MELLEIEKEFASPDKAQALAKYDAQLVALNERLEGVLAVGLPPDEFAKCDGLSEAITIARKLLRIQTQGKTL